MFRRENTRLYGFHVCKDSDVSGSVRLSVEAIIFRFKFSNPGRERGVFLYWRNCSSSRASHSERVSEKLYSSEENKADVFSEISGVISRMAFLFQGHISWQMSHPKKNGRLRRSISCSVFVKVFLCSIVR